MADITLFHEIPCSLLTGTNLASNQAFLLMSPLNHSHRLHYILMGLQPNTYALKKYFKFYIACQWQTDFLECHLLKGINRRASLSPMN